MYKYYITTCQSLRAPFYIKNQDGSPRVFSSEEADEFLKDKPHLVKVKIR